MCSLVLLAVALITIRMAGDVAHSIRLKLGLRHKPQERASLPVSLIEVFPVGDIPQPETSNFGNKLSEDR